MQIQLTKGNLLTDSQLTQVHNLIVNGNAASVSIDRLRACTLIAIATYEDDIIGIGAIKNKRPQYERNISSRSSYKIPNTMQEIGYFAVNPAYGNLIVAKRLLIKLLAAYTGDLFFTTSNDKIKALLVRAGFARQGQDWQGRNGTLTLMTRITPRLSRRARLWRAIQTTIPKRKGVLP